MLLQVPGHAGWVTQADTLHLLPEWERKNIIMMRLIFCLSSNCMLFIAVPIQCLVRGKKKQEILSLKRKKVVRFYKGKPKKIL